MPEQLRPESKDRGEAAAFIPHSPFIRGFHPNQKAVHPEPWTL